MNSKYIVKDHLNYLRNELTGEKYRFYSYIIDQQLEWELRLDYLILIKKVLNGEISKFEFLWEFRKRNDRIIDCCYFLESEKIILLPDQKPSMFADLIEQINDYYDWLEDEVDIAAFESDNELQNLVEEIDVQLQRILQDYPMNFIQAKDSSKLADQLTWENRIQFCELFKELGNSLTYSAGLLNAEHIKQKSYSIEKAAKELESNSIFLKLDYQAIYFSNFIKILIQLFEWFWR